MMIGLFFFVLSYSASFVLYLFWYYERKQKLHKLSQKAEEIPSRQSRRYHQSSMFSLLSYSSNNGDDSIGGFRAFIDRFASMSDVGDAIRKSGLGTCNLILGVDFTASNEWQGRRTFKRHCLHTILLKEENPYQRVISTIGITLEPFSKNGFVYAYGFGDTNTKDKGVFTFDEEGFPCRGFKDVMMRYKQLAKTVQLSGPTNFAPILNKAMDIVEASRSKYHILVIISDGQMRDEKETVEALIEASYYPLSIIMIGVGDGPWDTMEEFDDYLPRRKFDNFQFVDYNRAIQAPKKQQDTVFALHALMEIPDQYKAIKELGYI